VDSGLFESRDEPDPSDMVAEFLELATVSVCSGDGVRVFTRRLIQHQKALRKTRGFFLNKEGIERELESFATTEMG